MTAWFINTLGHRFAKTFETIEELDAFIDRAARVGTKLTGIAGGNWNG